VNKFGQILLNSAKLKSCIPINIRSTTAKCEGQISDMRIIRRTVRHMEKFLVATYRIYESFNTNDTRKFWVKS